MVTGFGKAEWGFSAKNGYSQSDADGTNPGELFSNRLGLVGLVHEQMGSFQIGKQWSVYSDVANWTDVYPIGGGAAMGQYEGYTGDGGVNGTGRADDALSYRGSFEGLNIGLQYQLEDSVSNKDTNITNELDINSVWHRKDGFQVALSYDFEFGFSLGYSYSKTQFEDRDAAEAQAIALKYSNELIYVAATYGEFKNHTNTVKGAGYLNSDPIHPIYHINNFDKKSTGYELFGRYDLPGVEGLGVYAGLNQLEVDESGNTLLGKNSKGKIDHKTLGAVYNIGAMQFAVEYTINDSADHQGNKDKDDYVNVQARYYF